MPTYEYACTSCGQHLEVVQSFTDEPLTTCPSCGSPLRKVFGNIGIVLKGSGFYKTDSRGPAPKSGSSGESPKGGETAPAASSSTDGSGSKDAAPSKPGSGESSASTSGSAAGA